MPAAARTLRLFPILLLILSIVLAPLSTFAADPAPASMTESLPDPKDIARIESSIDHALEYLLRNQQPDGSWLTWDGTASSHNGITAMCMLSFLGRGHEPGRGPFKQVVQRGVKYLISQQKENGFFGTQMYDHGLCTLALIEAYGFEPTDQLRDTIRKALDLTIKSQSPIGGWRYTPVPGDHDLSVTAMQVVALRAAVNARFDVPKATLDSALKYVKLCAAVGGGFAYQPGGGASPAQSAAGTLCMFLLGGFDDPATVKGLEYLKALNYDPKGSFFLYMSYYGMQANFQAGGDYWANWNPKVRDFFLNNQQEDGSFTVESNETAYNGSARIFSTAYGCMCLSVYMHYLPAYQR